MEERIIDIESAVVWMKANDLHPTTIEAVSSLIRYSKKQSILRYSLDDLIEDLKSGKIQGMRGIGFKKIEELFVKLQEDGRLKGYKITSSGKVRKKLFGIF